MLSNRIPSSLDMLCEVPVHPSKWPFFLKSCAVKLAEQEGVRCRCSQSGFLFAKSGYFCFWKIITCSQFGRFPRKHKRARFYWTSAEPSRPACPPQRNSQTALATHGLRPRGMHKLAWVFGSVAAELSSQANIYVFKLLQREPLMVISF